MPSEAVAFTPHEVRIPNAAGSMEAVPVTDEYAKQYRSDIRPLFTSLLTTSDADGNFLIRANGAVDKAKTEETARKKLNPIDPASVLQEAVDAEIQLLGRLETAIDVMQSSPATALNQTGGDIFRWAEETVELAANSQDPAVKAKAQEVQVGYDRLTAHVGVTYKGEDGKKYMVSYSDQDGRAGWRTMLTERAKRNYKGSKPWEELPVSQRQLLIAQEDKVGGREYIFCPKGVVVPTDTQPATSTQAAKSKAPEQQVPLEGDEVLQGANKLIDKLIERFKSDKKNAPILLALVAARTASGTPAHASIRALLKKGAIDYAIEQMSTQDQQVFRHDNQQALGNLTEQAKEGKDAFKKLCTDTEALTVDEATELTSGVMMGKLPEMFHQVHQAGENIAAGKDVDLNNMPASVQKLVRSENAQKAINQAVFGNENGLTWENIMENIDKIIGRGRREQWFKQGKSSLIGLAALIGLILFIGQTGSNTDKQHGQQ